MSCMTHHRGIKVPSNLTNREKGGGISTGREHARGANMPGAPAHQGNAYSGMTHEHQNRLE